MAKKNELNLMEGSLLKAIIRLGYPMALASLVQTLYNMADAFWLGKLGREALSAPIISFFLIFFIISIGLGFSISGTALVAQYTGAKERQKANTSTGNLLLYLMLMSIVLGGFGVLFARPLLVLLKTPADTFQYTLDYYLIVMAGMPLTFPMFVFQSSMNGYGDTMTPLKISLFAALLNMAMDPVLIFGWFGFPVMGVKGAAIMTVVSRGVASAIGLYYFFSGKKGIKLRLADLKPDISLSRLLAKIGIPAAVGFSGSSLGFIVLIGIVNQFGTPVVSAYGIGTQVIHLFMLPAMGISAAVTAIVGQNIGAGQIERAKKAVTQGLYLMLWIVIPAVIIISLFGKQLTHFFIPGDIEVERIGAIMFYIIPPSVIFFGLASVLEGAFQGAGNTVPVMITQLARLWVLRIPLVYLFANVLLNGPHDPDAAIGIWWGIVLSNGVSLLMLAVWFKKTDWTRPRIKKEILESSF